MKLSDFIKKLESIEGSPVFDNKSREMAADLSKKYTGRVVLSGWKAFIKTGERSFEMFNHKLPKDISKYINTLQEGELIGFTEKESTQAILLLAEYDTEQIIKAWTSWKLQGNESFMRFTQAIEGIINNRDEEEIENPFNQVLKAVGKMPGNTGPDKKEKSPENVPWTYDNTEGYMIGSMPIF